MKRKNDYCAVIAHHLNVSYGKILSAADVADLLYRGTYKSVDEKYPSGKHTLTKPAFVGFILLGCFFIVQRVASDAAAVRGSGDLAGWVAFAEYRQDRPADHGR